MDLYLALTTCYKQNIYPFELYSALSDMCKSNLALKEQVETLYKLSKQKDIFVEISNCTQTNFLNLLQAHDESTRDCLVSIARLLHPDWKLSRANIGGAKQTVKVQNGVISQRPQVDKVSVKKQGKQPTNQITYKNSESSTSYTSSIKIISLLSSLDVVTSQTIADFQVRVCQNGVWLACRDCIIKRQNAIFVNVENVVANKVEVLIPKGKYSTLTINKVCGELRIVDTDNCFDDISLAVSSGNVSCYTSARHVQAKVKVGKVVLEYIALGEGAVQVNNDLGGVRISTFFVKNINGKIFSQKGKISNKHKSAKGWDIRANIKAKYSDVEIL